MSYRGMQAIKHYKIVRKCPRCNRRLYHSGILYPQHIVRLNCADCGHDWTARYKKDEWD